MKKALIITAGVALASIAGGAESFRPAAGAAPPPGDGAPLEPRDGTVELLWDNGQLQEGGAVAWYTGRNTWAAADFDITTLEAYTTVVGGKIYYYPNWPNANFEGNRMAVYTWADGLPGEVLWGPTYVRGTAAGWNTFSLSYDLGGATSFCIAFEQYYGYPNCDAVVTYSTRTPGNHSWYYYAGYGAWRALYTLGFGDYALLLRCFVSDSAAYGGAAVTPTSMGRIKALFN